MYILNNLAFIAHPKTASTAMRGILSDMGAKVYGDHHAAEERWCRPILDSGGIIMATVRNPFDLLVSWYFHYAKRRRGAVMEPFNEWLPQQLANPNHYISQGLFYGLPWTNRVLRFERLQSDFDAVFNELGLDSITITPSNVSHIREGRPYQEMYDSKLRALVEQHFEDELLEFEYSFEE